MKPQNSPLQIWLPFLLALVWGLSWACSYFFYQQKNNVSSHKSYEQIQEILQYIEQYHADNPNTEKISEEIIKSFLNKLDPHSRYIPPSQLAKAHTGIESEFEGIGISYQILQDTLTVLGIVNNGPAQKAKIQIGDKLLKINQKNVAGKAFCPPIDTFFVMFRGDNNSKVQTEFLRKNAQNISQKLNITITRNTIASKSIEVAYMIDDSTGFVKIQRFSSEVYKEFKENITELKNKGAKRLILDVRDNGGGYLDRAVNMVDELLAGKGEILYTKGKTKNSTKYNAHIKGIFEEGKIIVLINENSASATEIFAGALQDHDRALLIGRKTFGKGLVQSPFMLKNGGELRLTISRYYTPSGRNIQKPYLDYLQDLKDEYPPSLFHWDSIKIDKSKAFKTTKGRTVYGGGGIIPDIFVPLDTAMLAQQIEVLADKQAFARIALDFFLKNKSNFIDISDRIFLQRLNELLAQKQDFILKTMSNMLQEDKNNFKENKKPVFFTFSTKDKQQINRRIMAEIARFLDNENLYFKIMSEEDNILKEAKKEMEK